MTELNPSGTALVYSTYLSGTASASGYGIAVNAGNIYVMGTNFASNFPTTSGAVQTSFSGNNSAWVARFDDTTTTTLTSSAMTVAYGQSLTVTATIASVQAIDGTPTGGTVTFTVDGVARTPVFLTRGSHTCRWRTSQPVRTPSGPVTAARLPTTAAPRRRSRQWSPRPAPRRRSLRTSVRRRPASQ